MLSKKNVLKVISICCFLLFVFLVNSEGQFFKLPKLPPDYEYGNLLINRTSEENDVKPATFSHWIHRQYHTCRVCHFELGFKFVTNETKITEEKNREGRYCGPVGCHDGEVAFGHSEEEDACDKCHNGDIAYGKENFQALQERLPKARYGNKINWARASRRGLIKNQHIFYKKPPDDLKFTKNLSIKAEWANIPSSRFPHARHAEWLDCNNCHPHLFEIKKKTTKNLRKREMLEGASCGLCHGTVAFPMNNCKRCHPRMKSTGSFY